MSFFMAANGWGGGGGKKATPPKNMLHKLKNDENCYSYTLPKEDQKII